MRSNSLVVATILVVSLFLISPALACNYPGPEGSSITVFAHTTDGTPLPGTQLTLSVFNGSKTVATESGTTGTDGKFTFPNDGSGRTGLTYKVHATYYGDSVIVKSAGDMAVKSVGEGVVKCVEGTDHSADSAAFTLGAGEKKYVDITISGVGVTHGGDDTPAPSVKPTPTTKPKPPKGDHASYPPMAEGDVAGSIVGVVLSNETSEPIAGAYVAIISATGMTAAAYTAGFTVTCTDPQYIEYSCMYTDKNGFFQFNNVNSTTDPVYMIYVTDGCGNKLYSEPFRVGSGETVKVNLMLDQKDEECPVVSPKPSATVEPGPDNATVTPSPPADAMGIHGDAAVKHNEPNILDRIAGFLGALISGFMPK